MKKEERVIDEVNLKEIEFVQAVIVGRRRQKKMK